MFDAKSILENIVREASPAGSGASSPSAGGAGDLLGNLLKMAGGGGGGSQPAGSLGDILGQISRSLTQGQGQSSADILAQLRDKIGQAGGAVTDARSVGDILGKVFTQATEGVKEGSANIGEATGATDVLGRLASDPQSAQIVAKIKDFIQSNPYAAGAAAGGLGGLMLGTRTGRSLAASTARLGALAMIGGLAYKAMQNYQSGRPLITGAASTEPPPAGSGFEPAAITNDAAARYIQVMIAAAHADGRIDAREQDTLLSSLKQAGLGAEAEAFLAKELNSPASVEELAQSVKSPEEAIQLYTAARMAVGDNSPGEQAFLASLASALKLDPQLTAHIDATAQAAV